MSQRLFLPRAPIPPLWQIAAMAREPRPLSFTAIQAEVGRRMMWARELVVPNRAEFARLCNVDNSTLTKIERGTRAPSLFVLRDYANKLRVSADFLLFGTLAGNDPELERMLIAHHPELVLGQVGKDRPQPDKAPAPGRPGDARKRPLALSGERYLPPLKSSPKVA